MKGAAIGAGVPGCQIEGQAVAAAGMVSNSDLMWLGVVSSVIGCLLGGMMLGIGLSLVVAGAPVGWLIMLPGAPVSAGVGWLLARRLAQQL